ncbi:MULTISPECIES: restriction endonuclease subunit S [Hungatella]|uniref:Restriction endonuclease subunit S n=2 Tax=Hungatella hathewayi TaxID=154046 RepID=A0AAW9WAF5_9FIRM|nr:MULTISPECIES: restriction endonuclease subunit S [Hungatella]MCQ4831403.1 restriction endonuclease subunit S [Hungatella sp. SL.1.14]MUB62151.1 restriction endonuclease subunit S [Hungatella hathewayi]
MRSEWKTVTVQELINEGMLERPLDGNHGAIHPKSSDYVSSGVPFVMAADLINGRIDYSNCKYITSEQAAGLRKGIARPGDVLLTHKATIGRTALVDDSFNTIILTPQVTYYRVRNGLYNKFLKYYFDTEYFQRLFFSWAGSGSTRAYLGITEQCKLPICFPSFPEQEAIANTLSSLDDKIELNNRINKNLEAQAQAIFKSWFVDFEPFQDGAFIDSDLGEIPKGWRAGVLSEVIEIKYGKDHKKLADGMIPVYGSGGIMRYADRALYESESVLVPRKGTLNNVIYINTPFWTVDTMFYTKMKVSGAAKMVYFFLKSKDLASMNAGTAVPSMTTDILNNIPMVIAPDTIIRQYDDLQKPLFEQMETLKKQNKTLSILRDTLLPKLMSGEIQIPQEV